LTGSEQGAEPLVSAIVVNWNTRELLAGCLENLTASTPAEVSMEIVVVDNGSRDGSAEMVAREWPNVTLIRNEENLGYTRANNQAIRLATAPWLLLHNTDARLRPDTLSKLLACATSNPQAGAVGPRLEYGDGSWQRWTAGRAPTLGSAAVYYLLLDRLLPFHGLFLGRDVRSRFRPDWVSSACMLVRSAALEQVGLLNEQFFVYMDDVDLCQRLRDGGWTVWYDGSAEAIHYGSASIKREPAAANPVAVQSFNRYFALQHGPIQAVGLKLIQATGFAMRVVAYFTASLIRGGDRPLAAKARSHWKHLRASLEAPIGI
jgi:N-acetylglucosaminyl-diphospho-decaprenol L-rhamnosyltransferase